MNEGPAFWRKKIQPVIARILDENEGKTEQQIALALVMAYPLRKAPNQNAMQKLWADEIDRQRSRGKYAGRESVEQADKRRMAEYKALVSRSDA